MSEPNPDRPPRRPRYRGTHPRDFREKYKELQPDRYTGDVAKILESGKTPAGSHRPILVREILEALEPKPGETAVDCTLGYGGHARELLAAVQLGGRLLGIDADPIELPKTEARLRGLGFPLESIVVRRMNYAGVAGFIASEAPGGADLILADLGLSSMQIDDPARGFTFKTDGPLDMRMNPSKHPSAAELLSSLTPDRLAQILNENADEPYAVPLAQAILRAHHRAPLETTRSLADLVRSAATRLIRTSTEDPEDSVRRVFQALRIAVNDEFAALDTFLKRLPECLKPGGRVAILSFHSGEDRRVKRAFKEGLQEGVYASVSPDVIRPSMEEQRANPRSTSAKLRYAVRGKSGHQ